MSPTAADPREAELIAFIDQLVARLQPLQLEHNRELWLANTTGDPSHEGRSAELDARIRLMFADREGFQLLDRLSAGGPLGDAILDRQLRLLHHAFRARQLAPEMIERQVKLEKKLESTFNNYRAELDGAKVTDNQILDVLRDSDDSARRRRAWEASKQVGVQVEADLLELVRLRNEGARSLGFRDFYAMNLELDELDETELFALLEDLDRDTQPLWDDYKGTLDAQLARRFGIAVADLRPWHYADPFFQQAPATDLDLDPFYDGRKLEEPTAAYFRAIGLPIEPLLELADLYERPGKCQHAFCMSVDRAAEIRVLCNLRSNEKWMGTMLHEYGHAVYDFWVDRSLPYLLRGPAHVLTTEASAMLFGRLSKNPAWMRRYIGADASALAAQSAAVARAVREQLLVQTRWELVMIHMERAVYRDPAQDLHTLWWDLVERYQGVTRPEGRDAPDWAAKIHFSIAPVYYQNYLLGEMLASQLQAHLLERLGGDAATRWERYVAAPEIGPWMAEHVYRAGQSLNWRTLVERATGRPLASEPFVADLSGRNDAA